MPVVDLRDKHRDKQLPGPVGAVPAEPARSDTASHTVGPVVEVDTASHKEPCSVRRRRAERRRDSAAWERPLAAGVAAEPVASPWPAERIRSPVPAEPSVDIVVVADNVAVTGIAGVPPDPASAHRGPDSHPHNNRPAERFWRPVLPAVHKIAGAVPAHRREFVRNLVELRYWPSKRRARSEVQRSPVGKQSLPCGFPDSWPKACNRPSRGVPKAKPVPWRLAKRR